MFTDFQTKPIYQKSKELYAQAQTLLSDKIPFPLKDQLLRALISIILNFSEGYGRFHQKEKKQFYVIARGSLNEVAACLDLVELHTKINPSKKEEILNLINNLNKMFSALINSQK